ncbi:IS66 family insertion sequence element accessory protein TnpA, partial [Pseudoalteromonas denitrificans]
MARRTLEDWQTIIEAQLASGLTIVKYCEQNKINPKTFSS